MDETQLKIILAVIGLFSMSGVAALAQQFWMRRQYASNARKTDAEAQVTLSDAALRQMASMRDDLGRMQQVVSTLRQENTDLRVALDSQALKLNAQASEILTLRALTNEWERKHTLLQSEYNLLRAENVTLRTRLEALSNQIEAKP